MRESETLQDGYYNAFVDHRDVCRLQRADRKRLVLEFWLSAMRETWPAHQNWFFMIMASMPDSITQEHWYSLLCLAKLNKLFLPYPQGSLHR